MKFFKVSMPPINLLVGEKWDGDYSVCFFDRICDKSGRGAWFRSFDARQEVWVESCEVRDAHPWMEALDSISESNG
jgi:hypothetical protein